MAVPGKFSLAASHCCCYPPPWLPRTSAGRCVLPRQTPMAKLCFSYSRGRGTEAPSDALHCPRRWAKMPYPGQGRAVSSNVPKEPGTAQSRAAMTARAQTLPGQDAGAQHWGHMADTAPPADLTALLENIANHGL